MKLVLTSLLAARYLAQHPGDGIAKTTWACNDPIPGWTFMKKYFPDQDGPAECENNVCDCTTDGKTWEIQEGRVNLDIASSSDVAAPGTGYKCSCGTEYVGSQTTDERASCSLTIGP